MKKTSLFLLVVIICIFLSACGVEKTVSPKEQHNEITPTDTFTVDFLNVGKADAMVLRTQNHTVLLDTGEKKDGKPIREYLKSIGITKLDYVIITHFDRDHVGGFSKIIKEIQTDKIIYPNYKGNNSEYEKFIESMNENNKTDTPLKEILSFTLDDTSFILYPPEKTSYVEDDNDFSIVMSVKHGDNTYLFAGDAEQTRLSEILRMGNLEHTVLKVPHHGRENPNSKKFIEAVKPKYAVICSDAETVEDNILKYLENVGAEVYKTFEGSVEMVSDGNEITVNEIEF